MKKLVLLFLLLPALSSAQWNEGLVVKIIPFNTFLSQNPAIQVEKAIDQRFSITLDLAYKRRWYLYNGQKGSFGRYVPSKGFSIGIIPKYYLGKKREAPFGWYVGAMLRYTHRNAINEEIRDVGDLPFRKVDVTQSRIGITPMVGYQLGGLVTFEFNAGLSFDGVWYTNQILSGEEYDDGVRYSHYKRNSVSPYMNITFGFNLSSRREKMNNGE